VSLGLFQDVSGKPGMLLVGHVDTRFRRHLV
jgi:hypothetical protein